MLQDSSEGCSKTPFHQAPHSSGLIPEYPGPTVTNGEKRAGRERPPPPPLDTLFESQAATPVVSLPVPLSISLSLLAIGNGGSFSGNFTLPPLGHRALFLADAIPGLPLDFQGTVRITEEGDKDFTALTLRSRGGVFSSLPSGEAARPLSHYEVIGDVFTDLLEAVILFELIPDPTSIEMAISYDLEIQAYGSRDGIQINIALAELLSDSESELAFIIGHELGHVYQYRTGKQDYHAANDELDADGWGLVLSLFVGYDPYAGAGALAKLEMAHGQADLDSQYLQEITDSPKPACGSLQSVLSRTISDRNLAFIIHNQPAA